MEPKKFVLDPTLCDFNLPLQAVYHPLGHTLEISTNSHEVLEAAQESWGHSRRLFPTPPIQFRVGVLEGGSGKCPPAPLCRAWRHLISQIANPQNFSVSDMRNGIAFCWLSQAAVENRSYLRACFLENSVLVLLHALYFTPIHAACVSIGGHGVLLCGDSGAGKSSLAYACARNGWTFLSDDSSCLARNRKDRVVLGNPHQMRFRESAVDLFPELKDQGFTLRATGELAIELPTAKLSSIKTASKCTIDFIVFLNREKGVAGGLRPFPKNRALEWFEQVISYGEENIRNDQRASLRNLLTLDVFELRYDDLGSAIQQLEALVEEGSLPDKQPSVFVRGSQSA